MNIEQILLESLSISPGEPLTEAQVANIMQTLKTLGGRLQKAGSQIEDIERQLKSFENSEASDAVVAAIRAIFGIVAAVSYANKKIKDAQKSINDHLENN